MVGAAIHEAYAPTMPGRILGYMVNLIAEDSGHNLTASPARAEGQLLTALEMLAQHGA